MLTNLPFAAVGGVLALWMRGLNLGVSAAVGFIALFGVAVPNGLVRLTTTERMRAEGADPPTPPSTAPVSAFVQC